MVHHQSAAGAGQGRGYRQALRRTLDHRVAVPGVEELIPARVDAKLQESCGRGLPLRVVLDATRQPVAAAGSPPMGRLETAVHSNEAVGPTVRQRRSRAAGSVARSPAHGVAWTRERPMLLLLLAEAPDPNRTRELLLERTGPS